MTTQPKVVDLLPKPLPEQPGANRDLNRNVAASYGGATKQPAKGVRFLRGFRASMAVPVVDFALMLTPIVWRPYQIHAVVAMAILGSVLLTGGGLRRYRARLDLSVVDDLPTIITQLLATVAAVASVLYLRGDDAVTPFLETAFQAIALVVAGRLITTSLTGFARRRGFARCNTLLIGGGQLSAELAEILGRHPRYGLVVVGFVDDGNHHPAEHCVPHLGRLADLDGAVAATGATALLVGDGNFSEREFVDAARTQACATADLLAIPRLHPLHTSAGSVDHIGSIPVIRVRRSRLHGPNPCIKRMFDLSIAVTACVISLPILIVAALAVRLECGRGVVLRQVRVGRHGKQFELLKFRTLQHGTGRETEPKWCVANTQPVGPVGRFLRATSIDELPQLWNIIRGDMSVVGPRPEQPYFVEQFSMQIDRYADRHRVQVGLTGLAQVNGLRQDTSITDRVRFDNFYIENWSLWLDVKIVLKTFAEVLLRRGS